MTTTPETSVLNAIEELNRGGFLHPATQKTLRLERFRAELPDRVARWIEAKLLPLLGDCFKLANGRAIEILELTFLIHMSDTIFPFAWTEEGMRETIEQMAEAMHVSPQAAYVALAIYVKQLGLDHDPPLLTIRGQRITWQEDTHRQLMMHET